MCRSSVGGIMVAPRKEQMMNALVLYDSQYGDTERIAQAIADTLDGFGEARAVRLDPRQPLELQGVDVFIVGCRREGWGPAPAREGGGEGGWSGGLGGGGGAGWGPGVRGP